MATADARAVRAAVRVAACLLVLPTWSLGAGAADTVRLPPMLQTLRGADFGAGNEVSAQTRQLADWIARTHDHVGVPFIIVDKQRASLFVFDARARLRGRSAVLLGASLGDDSVPDIGNRPMAQILPAERTTPAGRFVSERGRNASGEDIVWVDYDAAVSMHRVRTSNPVERRGERLATPTIADNRISYGCINVPVTFYESYIQPIFARSKAVVYVMPDRKSINEVFGIPQRSDGPHPR
jgi:hypothetical protein